MESVFGGVSVPRGLDPSGRSYLATFGPGKKTWTMFFDSPFFLRFSHAEFERKPNLSSLSTSKTQAYYGPVEVRILPAHCRIPGTLAVSMIVTHFDMRMV